MIIQEQQAINDARKQLVKNAIDCTYYVACGKIMSIDIAKQNDVSEFFVKQQIDLIAIEIERVLTEWKATF